MQDLLRRSSGSQDGYTLTSPNNSRTNITSSDVRVFSNYVYNTTGAGPNLIGFLATGDYWTSGVASNAGSGTGSSALTDGPSANASLGGSNSVTGTSASSGTGSAYDSRPLYISAVYLMRVK